MLISISTPLLLSGLASSILLVSLGSTSKLHFKDYCTVILILSLSAISLSSVRSPARMQ